LFVRISATDWVEGGWDLEQSIELARAFRKAGVKLIDVSSGAMVPYAKIPVAKGFQVPFAEAIRRETGISTGAVGMITEPHHANEVITSGAADLVFLAREMLRDPYWPIHAEQALQKPTTWPIQYGYVVEPKPH
jgi:2,4-dienoyl-CoA reductase (NADPH2)